MSDIQLGSSHFWKPFYRLGYTHSFFNLDAEIILHTWFMMVFLFTMIAIIRFFLHQKNSLIRFLSIQYVGQLKDLCSQTIGNFQANHFYFISSIFTFILFCNMISLIPWIEEPTKSPSTTFALSLISFFYIQWFTIATHGLGSYIKEYFSPFFIFFPLNIIGKLSSVVSMAFRLFGNIFGGATISSIFFGVVRALLPVTSFKLSSSIMFLLYFTTTNIINLGLLLFFGIFEGFIQALVFTMLTLTYLSSAIYVNSSKERKSLS